MRRIETMDDIDEGLSALCSADRRLASVLEIAGTVPLRRHEPGFASLASVIVSQQVSTSSAAAIFGRLCSLLDPLSPRTIRNAHDDDFRQAGLSRPKQRAIIALAEAMEDGLDLHAIARLDGDAAIGALTGVSGIGPWTAEVYLMTCAGHPDIFPAKDVALQAAMHSALSLESRPSAKAVSLMAESWSPWRSVAARLFWSYYRATKGRDGLLTAPAATEN